MDKKSNKIKKYGIVFLLLGLWTLSVFSSVDKASAFSNVAAAASSKVQQVGGDVIKEINNKIDSLTKKNSQQDNQLNTQQKEINNLDTVNDKQDNQIKNVKVDNKAQNQDLKDQQDQIKQLNNKIKDLSLEPYSALFLWDDTKKAITEKEMLSLLVWSNFDVIQDNKNPHTYFVDVKKEHKLIPRPLPAINELLKKYPDIVVAYPLMNKFLCSKTACGNNNGYPWVWEIIS